MAETWNDVDSGGEYSQTWFSNFENHYIHNSIVDIVAGDLVMLQLTSYVAAGTSRSFSVTGANGLTWALQDSYVSADGKTRSELWYAVATTTIGHTGARGSSRRIALPVSSITEDALVYACRVGNGIPDTAAWLAGMVEGDFSTAYLETGSLEIDSAGASTFYAVTTIPSVQSPTGGSFTPNVDFGVTNPAVQTNSYAGNGFPGAVLGTWDAGTDGTEYVRNQHNGGSENWHIWGFPGASEIEAFWGIDLGTGADAQ